MFVRGVRLRCPFELSVGRADTSCCSSVPRRVGFRRQLKASRLLAGRTRPIASAAGPRAARPGTAPCAPSGRAVHLSAFVRTPLPTLSALGGHLATLFAARRVRVWACVAAVLVAPACASSGSRLGPASAAAQRSSTYATRAALTQALADAQRRGARDEAARLRERLTTGDMRPGDRLAVTLTVDSTRQLDLVVRDSQRVEVPPFAPLSLRGVLRSELQPVMLRYFQQYYRNPDVRVQPLIRVGVLGAVQKPGYYAIAPDAFVTDLLTDRAGGGTAGNADSRRIEVKRGGQKVLDQKGYQRAAREGLTLADAGVRSGDELQVPERKGRSVGQIIQTVFFGVSALTSLLFLIRAFYNN